MAKLSDLYPSRFIRAADLEGEDKIVTISAVEMEMVGQGEKAETKPVLYFEGETTGLVCNKTNATTIGDLYGQDTDDWIGKRIVLYPTEVNFAGEMVEAVRVRNRKHMEQRAAKKRAAATVPPPKKVTPAAADEPPPPNAEWELAGSPEEPPF